MADLIDRQAAIDAIDGALLDGLSEGTAIEILSELPSVQPEIVRCKDCKYWTHIKRTNRYWCKTDDGLFDINTSPDDFCSRAERRTDE